MINNSNSADFFQFNRTEQVLTEKIDEKISQFQVQPGSTLATAIAERCSLINSSTNQNDEKNVSLQTSTTSNRIDSFNRESEEQSIVDVENIKYKTELCRNFSIYGSCSYSSRCQFAHGQEELRQRIRHPKYKTEFCRNFLSGFCKYGSRCQFLHSTEDLKSLTDSCPSTALETYLLTNMFAQTAALTLSNSMIHQSALVALSALENISTNSNSFYQRTLLPLNCSHEIQQNSSIYSHLPLTTNFYDRIDYSNRHSRRSINSCKSIFNI